MKKIFAMLLSLAMVFSMTPLAFLCESYAEEASVKDTLYYGDPGEDYEEGEVIVCVQGGTQALVASGIFSKEATKLASSNKQIKAEKFDGLETRIAKQEITIDETLMEFDATESDIDEATSIQTQEEETKSDEEPYSFVLVKSSKDDVTKLIKNLEALDCVVFAEPNMKCEPTSTGSPLTLDDAEDEPAFNYQWYTNKEGVGANFDLSAKTAYSNNEFANQQEVVVAVMDSGVDYTHPDLQDSMWKGGKMSVLKSLGGGQYGINTSGGTKSNPMDTFVGHGTHCASTIASNWKNQKGVAGINGNAKIMACKWMDEDGYIDDWITAMNYVITAKKNGVNVVATNNSWGTVGASAFADGTVNIIAKKAGELGIVSCFAAGNDEYDHDKYTNMTYSSPYIVTVGAMQSNGTPATFSERGARTVDVFAPGAQILAATTLYAGEYAEMAPQYLPWLQPSTDSVIYEDFEDDNDLVEVKAVKISGSGSTPTKIKRNQGLGDSKSIGLNLSNTNNGDRVGFEIHVPKETITSLGSNVYMAFETGSKDLSFSDGDDTYGGNEDLGIMEYWDGSEWILMEDDDEYPVLIANYSDLNCSVMTAQLTSTNISEIKAAATNAGVLKLRLAIRVEEKGANPEFYIDNFGIGKALSNYYYSDGTSMATPCATAVTSLIAGTYPNGPQNGDDALEIIARLKGGVKKTNGLDNECLTQGCVQADSAFKTESELNPVPTRVVANNDGTATIDGYFFGTNQGQVSINGANITVNEWTDKRIKIEVPAGTENIALEYKITKSNGKKGRAFGIFKTNTSDNVTAYRDLNVSEQTYQIEGQKVKAAELIPIGLAADDDGIMALLTDTTYNFAALEFYSFDTQEWSKVKDYKNFSIYGDYTHCMDCSIVGSGHRIYLYCPQIHVENNGYFYYTWHLLTYNTENNSWLYKTNLIDNRGGSVLGIIDDELHISLGYQQENVCIRKINPGNGNISASSFSDYYNLDYYLTSIGGSLLTSGSKMRILAGVYDANSVAVDTEAKEPLIIKNGNWTQSENYFYHESRIDANQNGFAAYAPTDQGFIVVGPSHNIGKSGMVDTWSYEASSDSYTALPVLADSGRLAAEVATCHEGKMYLLARSNTAGNKLIFKSLKLSNLGLSYSKPVSTEPGLCLHSNLVHAEEKSASCTKTGNHQYWKCNDCGKYFKDQNHTLEYEEDEWVIDKLGHDLTHIDRQPATETADGWIEHWICSRCNNRFSDNTGRYVLTESEWKISKKSQPTPTPPSGGGGFIGGNTDEQPKAMPDVDKLTVEDVAYATSSDNLKFVIKGLENLEEGTDYTVHLLGLNPNSIGKHSAEIVFLNTYSNLGTISIEYVCVPKGTSISKLKAKKKSFSITLKKQKVQTTGYQIRYSLKSNMKSSKTATIKKNSITSHTIKKLKSKKKYYVQIRTYKNVKEGKKTVKYCSSWSKAKSIKVK